MRKVSSVCARHHVDCRAGGAGARDAGAGERRVSRFGRGPAARRSPAADRAGHELRSHHLGRRRHDLAVDVRARRDVDGVGVRAWARPPAIGCTACRWTSAWPSPTTIRAAGIARAARSPPRSRPTTFPIRPTPRACWRSSGAPADARARRGRRPRIDRRRRQLRRHAALRRARRRRAAGRRDRARRSAHHLPRDRHARTAPGARALGRRGRDTGRRSTSSRRSARARPASSPSIRSTRTSSTCACTGAGVELLAVSRDGGMTLRHADHADGRRAERVRAPGERHGAGRRPGAGRRRLTTAGVAWRSGDGGVTFDDWTLSADAAPARARRARRHAVPRGQTTTRTAGRWRCPSDEGRTIQPIARYDQVSAVKACVAAVCQELCDEQAGRKIWAPEVCNPPPDGGADAGPPAKLATGCGCGAAPPRGGAGIAVLLVGARYGAAKCGETATPRNSGVRRRGRDRRPDRRAGAGVDEHDQAVGRSRPWSPST